MRRMLAEESLPAGTFLGGDAFEVAWIADGAAMKKLLNVLYVTTQETYLSLEGETVVVSLKQEKLAQFPLINLQGIVCLGNIACSPFLLGACAENGIAVSFLTKNGRFLARIQGGMCGNILLRKQQFRLTELPEKRSALATVFLIAKMLNSRSVLQRFLRDHGELLDEPSRRNFDDAVAVMKNQTRQHYQLLMGGKTLPCEELLGVEGSAANRYFSCFGSLITAQKNDFQFAGRNRRPPLDRVNAMLSFAYTLLAHDCVAALESVGLDPAAGFLHADRPGRPSLALDLMEELRACFADRLVLSLINLRRVAPQDFKFVETGAVRMNEQSRKILIGEWQDRKQDEIMHPYLKEKIRLGLVPFVQSLLLARFIRGDIDAYPPFIFR